MPVLSLFFSIWGLLESVILVFILLVKIPLIIFKLKKNLNVTRMPRAQITKIEFRRGLAGVRDFTWTELSSQRTKERALRYLDEQHPLPVPVVRPYRTRSKVRDLCRRKINCYAKKKELILRVHRRLGGRLIR